MTGDNGLDVAIVLAVGCIATFVAGIGNLIRLTRKRMCELQQGDKP